MNHNHSPGVPIVGRSVFDMTKTNSRGYDGNLAIHMSFQIEDLYTDYPLENKRLDKTKAKGVDIRNLAAPPQLFCSAAFAIIVSF